MTNDNTNDSIDLTKSIASKYYIFGISPHIHDKLGYLICMLKKVENLNLNRQSWILDAIKERLDKNKNSPHLNKLKEKSLHVKLDEQTADLLEKEVEFIRNYRRSFSKKQWILEAILEKIDQDEEKLKKLLEKVQHDHKK